MRNPMRRFSIPLLLSKPVQQPPPLATTDGPTLLQFLTKTKEKFLNDMRATPPIKPGEWTVVMGNEAGDLDTLASCIGYAWLQSEVHKKPTIPLLQLERDDLDLRLENTHALTLAGIDNPKDQLFFLTDIKEFKPFPCTNFALVDHNTLSSTFSTLPNAKVTAIIDHHKDEEAHKDTANPRTITSAGSCASHIASLCPSEIPPTLATLLLSAILIDTSGLKPDGKALAVDHQAAGFLASRSTLSHQLPQKLVSALLDDSNAKPDAVCDAGAIRELTSTLRDRKADVTRLSGRDLLRRDYKEYRYAAVPWLVDGSGSGGGGDGQQQQTVLAGLASIPIPLKDWPQGNSNLGKAAIAWMEERGLAVLGLLTSFREGSKPGKPGKGKHRREMAWIVYDGGGAKKKDRQEGDDDVKASAASVSPIDVDKLATRLWKGLEQNAELKLKKHKRQDIGEVPSEVKVRVYDQGNVDATRKAIAPVLSGIMTEAQDDSVASGKDKKER